MRSRLSSSASRLFGLATESCEPDVIVCTVDRSGVMIHSVTKPEMTSRIAWTLARMSFDRLSSDRAPSASKGVPKTSHGHARSHRDGNECGSSVAASVVEKAA